MTDIPAPSHLYAAFEQELVTNSALSSLYGPYPEAMALQCVHAGRYTFDARHTHLTDVPAAARDGLPTLPLTMGFQAGVLTCAPVVVSLQRETRLSGAVVVVHTSEALCCWIRWARLTIAEEHTVDGLPYSFRLTFPLGLAYVRGLTPAWMGV